ncbi:hypothetical protein J6590_050895, partial [Homalodisca vitripennis]
LDTTVPVREGCDIHSTRSPQLLFISCAHHDIKQCLFKQQCVYRKRQFRVHHSN